jgi:ABC-type lipopolysaccharide export system ATPase subunit
LPRTSSVLVDLTVAENLAVFERRGIAGRARAARRAADWRGIGAGRADGREAGALSGGERRRLGSRALSAWPSVLL